MSGIYIDGISLGENSWAIISKFFRAVVGPTDMTVEGRFVEEHGKIWLILNGERHAVTQVPDHGRLIDAGELFKDVNESVLLTRGFKETFNLFFDEQPIIIEADEEAGE